MNEVKVMIIIVETFMIIWFLIIDYKLDKIKDKVSETPIRCKDCRFFDHGIDEDGKAFTKCIGWCYGGTSRNDFCSHAEKKKVT